MHLALTLMTLSVGCGLAQFVAPPPAGTFKTVDGPLGIKIRYKQVATGQGSICELHPNVTSYSGFVDISPNEHYFFWFFSARYVDPSEAHLTAWISGGPGASSMSELMTEHGPCRVNRELKPTYNPFSWNTNSNVVYIDQPTTVGYSYTDPVPSYIGHNCDIRPLPHNDTTCPHDLPRPRGCWMFGDGHCGTYSEKIPQETANSTEAAASKFWLALQGIYAAFPQYAQKQFTLASESYGGHYAPVFSRYIARQNADLPKGAVQIDQSTVQVNNGWYDPRIGYSAFYQYLVNPGNPYGITLPKKKAKRMYHRMFGKGQCLDQLEVCNSHKATNKNCASADNFCAHHVQHVYSRSIRRDTYDIRELNPDPYPDGQFYINYLNSDRVIKELGVFTNYTDDSSFVTNQFSRTGDDARALGILQTLAEFIDAGVSVTLMHGDSDYNCNWIGGRISAEKIAGFSKKIKDVYPKAGWENLTTIDGIVHGQVRQAGPFSFIRVYEAGHQVGFFQPLTEQTIYNRSIAGLDIATGTKSVLGKAKIYRSQGPSESTYMEGNATVQFHKLPPNALYNYTSNRPTLSQGTGTSSNIGCGICED